MDTRIDKRQISDNVQLKKRRTVTVEMEIQVVFNIGLSVEDLTLSVNHERQTLDLFIPFDPKVLKIVDQNYKIIAIRQKKDPTGQKKLTGNFADSVDDWKHIIDGANRVFNTHQTSLTELDRWGNPIEKEALEKIIPTLVKIFEPLVAVGGNAYGVNIKFGNYSRFRLLCKY
ncbi:MAG: hypothetical protein DHS20C18_21640 [Saprospiraceae bacterium]|nr:MAG: hypothetical protein DHS20C18_21640 [Saprospiraceae bacterium]